MYGITTWKQEIKKLNARVDQFNLCSKINIIVGVPSTKLEQKKNLNNIFLFGTSISLAFLWFEFFLADKERSEKNMVYRSVTPFLLKVRKISDSNM
jgi:hypothetical protein